MSPHLFTMEVQSRTEEERNKRGEGPRYGGNKRGEDPRYGGNKRGEDPRYGGNHVIQLCTLYKALTWLSLPLFSTPSQIVV